MSKRPFVFNFIERLNYERIFLNNTNPLELLDRLNISEKETHHLVLKYLILTKKMDIEADFLGIQCLKTWNRLCKINRRGYTIKFWL